MQNANSIEYFIENLLKMLSNFHHIANWCKVLPFLFYFNIISEIWRNDAWYAFIFIKYILNKSHDLIHNNKVL